MRQDYTSHEEARAGISSGLLDYYSESYPDLAGERQDVIENAGKVLGDLYATNVYPSMKIEWGTYPNHIGHESFPGCFRCHDDEHSTPEGETISQDCSTCHSLLAWEEENPEILEQLQP